MAEAPSAINVARSGTSRVRAPSRLGAEEEDMEEEEEGVMERLVVVHRRLGMLPSFLSIWVEMNADWVRYQLLLRWCRPLVARLCPGIEVLQLLWRREFLAFLACRRGQLIKLRTRDTLAGIAPSPRSGLVIPAGLKGELACLIAFDLC